MGSLQLQHQNYRAAGGAGKRVLLHVPTTSVFELDRVSDDLLGFIEQHESVDAESLTARFDGTYAPGDVCDALSDFVALGVVAPRTRTYEIAQRPVTHAPIGTLVLTLTTGCNLSCSYCYRDDLRNPRSAQTMTVETGLQAIDLLLRQAADRERVAIVFFGGEPLTRFAAIRTLTLEALARAQTAGKQVDFSLTTNATLLSEEMIAFFRRHAFGISVSIDGSEAEHDRRRITIGGRGTYRQVAANARKLIGSGLARPVGARVTLSRGNTDVEGIFRHLREEIGFAEIGFAPVTARPGSPDALDPDEMRAVLDGMKALGRDFVKAARRGWQHGFSNMNHLLLDLTRGTRKVLPCGAGLGLLAAGTDGTLSLCHRFTGTGSGSFGDVVRGVDMEKLGAFVDAAQHTHESCRACPARGICAGGCYHEAYVRTGDPLAPTFDQCEFVREWLDFGLECYAQIATSNPAFLTPDNIKQRELT